MKELQSKTYTCTASSGQLLLFLSVILECAVGIVFVMFGITSRRLLLWGIGVLFILTALLLMLFRHAVPPGCRLVSADAERLRLHSFTGVHASLRYDNIEWVSLSEDGQTLAIRPVNSDGFVAALSAVQQKNAIANLAECDAPLLLKREFLSELCPDADLSALCWTIENNRRLSKNEKEMKNNDSV